MLPQQVGTESAREEHEPSLCSSWPGRSPRKEELGELKPHCSLSARCESARRAAGICSRGRLRPTPFHPPLPSLPERARNEINKLKKKKKFNLDLAVLRLPGRSRQTRCPIWEFVPKARRTAGTQGHTAADVTLLGGRRDKGMAPPAVVTAPLLSPQGEIQSLPHLWDIPRCQVTSPAPPVPSLAIRCHTLLSLRIP